MTKHIATIEIYQRTDDTIFSRYFGLCQDKTGNCFDIAWEQAHKKVTEQPKEEKEEEEKSCRNCKHALTQNKHCPFCWRRDEHLEKFDNWEKT